MLEQLTDEERTALSAALADSSVREIGDLLGCGKDKAAVIKKRVFTKIRLWANELPDGGEAAVEILVDLVDNTVGCVIEFSGA